MEFQIQNPKVIEYISENEINIENFLEVYTELDKYIRRDRQKTLEYNSILNSIQRETNLVKNIIETKTKSGQDKIQNEIQDLRDLLDKPKSSSPELIAIAEKVDNLSEIVKLIGDNNSLSLRQFLNTEISELKENISSKNGLKSIDGKLDNILQEYREIMSKFENNSKVKGNISEQILLDSLIEEFPESEILDYTQENGKGDFWIITENCPTIMVDIKNYKTNIPKKEIDKFKKDSKNNRVCGILFSADSGISTKKDFQVELIGNCVLIYISKGKLSVEKIKFASNIIYSVYNFIDKSETDKIEITQEIIDKLAEEYENFLAKKEKAKKSIRDTLKIVEDIYFPSLNAILEKDNTEIHKTNKYTCQICGKELANKYSLKRHKSSHE